MSDVRRQVTELFGDVFRRVRPDAIRMRIIGTPHQRFDTQIFYQLKADAIELERRLALAAPVLAWQQLKFELPPMLVLILVVAYGSSKYGIQPMPLSPKTTRRLGNRSKTVAPISAVRMLPSVIWNRQIPA